MQEEREYNPYLVVKDGPHLPLNVISRKVLFIQHIRSLLR